MPVNKFMVIEITSPDGVMQYKRTLNPQFYRGTGNTVVVLAQHLDKEQCDAIVEALNGICARRMLDKAVVVDEEVAHHQV